MARGGAQIGKSALLRHSVTQASTSGTGEVFDDGAGHFVPPFSNTGINEWHWRVLENRRNELCRHSVTQASTSGTAINARH